MICEKCESTDFLKQGVRNEKQRYSCKSCGTWASHPIETEEAKKGNIPEIGLEENLKGLEVTGVTYLKKDDNNVLHWVKTKTSTNANFLKDFADRLIESVEPRSVIKCKSNTANGVLTQYTVTDLHVGAYSWIEETGANYNLKICYDMVTKAMDRAIACAPRSEIGMLMELGDFLHYDGHSAVTPLHGNLLDADGRFQHMLEVGQDILIETIDKLLEKHKLVKVIIAQGNHDISTSDTLRSLIKRYYKNNPRLEVIGGPNPFYAYKHGNTMIGAHHGHLKKRVSLPAHFSQFFAEMWGSTEYRYLHSGHLHCHHEEERGGALTIQHSTLAAPDAYAAHRFDKTNRSINTITYSDKHGMILRGIIPISMCHD